MTIAVLVHPGEDVFGLLLGRVRGSCSITALHVVDGLHNLGHLLPVDHAVPVHVVHPVRPLELLLRGAVGADVDGEQELLEVDVTVLVRVEGSARDSIQYTLNPHENIHKKV